MAKYSPRSLYIGGTWCGWALLVLLAQGCGSGGSGGKSPGTGSSAAPGSCVGGLSTVSINSFSENPRTSSGNGALAFNSTLTTAMTTPVSLTGLSGNCLLQSSRYSITSDTFFSSSIAKPTSVDQLFAPSAGEFGQYNSFYYAQALSSLVVNTLGGSLPGQISIDAHCNQQDNAFFSPSSKRLCFGFHNAGGGKKVWAADDADVVVHEAGHSVNHSLASTDIMGSTQEAGAIDEGVADYWALTVLDDPELSEWFLGSIGSSYIRDATANLSYPANLDFEVHDDARMLTEVLWDLRSSGNLGKADTDKLVKRTLQLLPATTRFSNFYEAFYDASGPAFLNLTAPKRALIVTKFTNKGIHRADSAAGLSVAQVKVIDDHSYSFQSGGNCNGVLDVNETALVLVNLSNAGSEMGVGVATLGAAPSGISVPSGGEVGEFFRMKAGSNFVSSLPAAGSSREEATVMASFVVRATSAGVKNFSLTFKPMYSDPTGTLSANSDVTVNFSLTVGSTATSSSCSSAALWP